jgi:hypothetical protein
MGATCLKDFSLTIGAPSVCGSNPASVQDAVWTKDMAMPALPCADAAITAGAGTWTFQKHTFPGCAGWVGISAPICNPGADYTITVTIPWDSSGNVVGMGINALSFTLEIGGVSVDSALRNVTGPITVVVLTGTLPGGTTSTVRIYIASIATPNPQFDIFSIAPHLTITPLAPP